MYYQVYHTALSHRRIYCTALPLENDWKTRPQYNEKVIVLALVNAGMLPFALVYIPTTFLGQLWDIFANDNHNKGYPDLIRSMYS